MNFTSISIRVADDINEDDLMIGVVSTVEGDSDLPEGSW